MTPSSSPETPRAAGTLEERLEQSERERAELLEKVEERKHENARLEELFAELTGGRPRKRSLLRRLAISALLVVAIGGGGYVLFVRAPSTTRPVVHFVKDSKGPSLLVTSVPEGAMVRIDGELVGLTPVLVALAPLTREVQLLLEAPGHAPLEKRVRVKATAGAHLHAVLSSR
jgi:hypothetical protein